MTRRLWWALRLAMAAALLALVARLVDLPEALALLAGASPLWLVLAVALLSAQIVLSALRWRLTAARLGHAFGTDQAVREYYLGVLANFALPGGVVGDAARAVRARHGAGLGVAVQAVVLERAAGQVALVLVLVPGLLLWPGMAALGLALAGALALAALALALGPGRRVGRVVARAWLGREVLPAQAGLSAAILATNLGGFGACAAATGAALPLEAVLVLVPLTLAAMLVPVTVAGWGLREGTAALLWPLAGLSAEEGVAASVAFGLAALVAALPGLAVLLRARGAAG